MFTGSGASVRFPRYEIHFFLLLLFCLEQGSWKEKVMDMPITVNEEMQYLLSGSLL